MNIDLKLIMEEPSYDTDILHESQNSREDLSKHKQL